MRSDHSVHRVCAHPAGIGAAVTVEDTLVIARRRHRNEGSPIRQDNVRKFLPLERVFEQHARAAVAELMLLHQAADERLGLRARFRHEDAFSPAQPVGLDHHRPIHRVQRANRFHRGVKIAVQRGRRDFVPVHELLRVNLAALEPRVPLRRTHKPHVAAFEFVPDARDQRRFRSDDGEVRLEPLGQSHNRRHIVGVHMHTLGGLFNPAVARRAPDFLDFRRLTQPPDHRVLASPASDHQDFHSRLTIDAGTRQCQPWNEKVHGRREGARNLTIPRRPRVPEGRQIVAHDVSGGKVSSP